MILYQAIRFILPGLTRREQRLLAPVVFGSSILFIAGLAFAYTLLAPAALGFFINYGADVVEQLWSIDRYVDFILLLLLAAASPSKSRFSSWYSLPSALFPSRKCSANGATW